MRMMKREQSALSPSFVTDGVMEGLQAGPSSLGGAIPRHRDDDEDADAGIIIARRPHSYVCKFCAREFRNAQALGGHMNVHRRERALANQLVELHNHYGHAHAHAHARGSSGAAAAAAARIEPEQDVITHACDMHSGSSSSSSSSSPPSSESLASCLVPPWPSLRPKAPPRRRRRRDSVDLEPDLELRLGLTPKPRL